MRRKGLFLFSAALGALDLQAAIESRAKASTNIPIYEHAPTAAKEVPMKPILKIEVDKLLDLGSTPRQSVEKALQVALEQILEPSEELESPLNNVWEIESVSKDWPKDSRLQLQRVRERLVKFMNHSETKLVLLEEGKAERGFAPERGEDLKKNWIFSLIIPTLSDHVYWIVVAKEAPYKAYVYGFN